MIKENENAIEILKLKAKELHDRPRILNPFSNNQEADILLNNIEDYPHFFVLGCVMNRQIKASRAWLIPYKVSQLIGSIDFYKFLGLDQKETTSLFVNNSLHRMPTDLSECFFEAVQRIHQQYSDDASNIWHRDNPSCGEVIRRFREFHGVGQKISTMAVNVLVRDFKVNLSGESEIDMSLDVHVGRVFQRLGIVEKNAGNNEILSTSRQLVPEYPGYFDSLIWEIGEAWCKPSIPLCDKCFLNKTCPKLF